MLALLTISYLVFIFNAEKIVKEIVTHYTKGTMKIEMKKLRFNPRELRITIVDAHITTLDTVHQNSTYNITVDTMLLELASVRPLLLDRKLYIDSITFKRPSISVIQWREEKKEKFSLPQQMGKVYNSLNHTLDKLSIKYCLLDSGAFSIEDKVHPERKKVTVTDFYFLIDNLHKTSSLNKDDRFFFSDRIKFYSSHQKITLASGNQQISYSRLRINSSKKTIELDSCFIYSKKNNSEFSSFSGYFDTLKFTNVDFKKLTQDNILDADSAYCIQPKIILKTSIKENKADGMLAHAMSRDSFTVLMKYLLGNFNLDYIGVDNAAIEIQTKSDSKISSYQIKRTDFSMHDVSIIDHPDSAIKVGSFDLGIIGYQAYDTDSSYLVKFDSIHFVNEKIFLSNFKISPAKKIQTNEFKDISMSSLAINNISWIDLLANRKIVANDIELINPELDLHLKSKKDNGNDKKKLNVLVAFQKITDYADVKNLKIRNAQFQLNQGDKIVMLKNLNCNIPVNGLLKSKSLNDFLSASLFFDFESAKLDLKKYQISLKKGRYDGTKSRFFIYEALANDNENLFHGYFQSLIMDKPLVIKPDHFDFSSLSWDKATISLTSNASVPKLDHVNSNPFFNVSKIQGKNSLFQTNSNGYLINGLFSKIDILEFATEDDGSFKVKDISLNGNKISFVNKGLRLNINQLNFYNKKTSSIAGLYFNADSGKKKITLNIPKFDFSADINDLIKKQFVLSDIIIQEPTVSILNNDSFQSNQDISNVSKFPQIKISSIIINNPEIHDAAFDEKFQPYLNKIKSLIQLNDVHLKDEIIQVDNGKIELTDMKFSTPKISLSVTADDIMKLSLSNINFTLGNKPNKSKWNFLIDTLSSSSILLKLQKDSLHAQSISFNNASVSAVQISNSKGFSLLDILTSSPELSITHTHVYTFTNQSRFLIHNLNFNKKLGELGIGDFYFVPTVDKEDFVKMNDYQKDYPFFKTGKINVKNFDVLKLVKDSVLAASYVNVLHPDLYIYKDKRKPFKKGIYKPLPSALLKKVNFKFDIDSLQINEGIVTYEELNEKTNKSGVVKFSHLNAMVNNVKNHNHIETDSLRLYVTGNFMDSAKIRFRLAESFTDSLHTFTYGLRFRPFDFKILNPILEPLVSARIISGSLDTLRVNAIGREHMSHGKMKMYYNDLRIQYLNKGSDSVKNFKSRLINFVANDLLLKRNNKKGFGIVYAERDKERGFANYWMKIGLSGVVSSSGVKKNKKVEKIYRNKLKKMKVPDIPDVDL